jgi:hypothetical protein
MLFMTKVATNSDHMKTLAGYTCICNKLFNLIKCDYILTEASLFHEQPVPMSSWYGPGLRDCIAGLEFDPEKVPIFGG